MRKQQASQECELMGGARPASILTRGNRMEDGSPPETLTRLAREMAARFLQWQWWVGPPLAQTNGLFTALAVNALNSVLGSVGKPGGLQFTPEPPLPASGWLGIILERERPFRSAHLRNRSFRASRTNRSSASA